MTAAPSVADTVTERRIAPRLQPAFRTVCRLNHTGAGGYPVIGLVWNLSETGVSMMMANPPKPGIELTGELAPEDGGPGLPISLRVVHVRPISTGDFFLGARFGSPLESDKMQVFLAAPQEVRSNGAAHANWSLPKKG